MKTFPALYDAQKNLKTGASPVWILKISAGGVDYYVSDSAFSIGPWDVTTKAWVKSWGTVTEGISGLLDEFKIGDFTVTCLADPDDAPNVVDLALSYNLEKDLCSLHKWYVGCADPPQEFFRGYIRDYPISEGDTVCTLHLQDETLKWAQAYLGTKLTLQAYPKADPDDVGKVIPIIYGSVDRLPVLCVDAGVVTTCTTDVAAADTSIAVGSLQGIAVNTVLNIGLEQVKVTSVNTSTGKITVTRGYNGTVAAAYATGSSMWEKKATPLVYLVADHAVTSIGKVTAVFGSVEVDITDSCTIYLGTSGHEHASYPGKAVITIADMATVQQRVQLSVSQGSHSHVSVASTSTTTVLPNSANIDAGSTYSGHGAASAYDGDASTYMACSYVQITYYHAGAVSGSDTPFSFRAALTLIDTWYHDTYDFADVYYQGSLVYSFHLYAHNSKQTIYSPWFSCSAWADFSSSGTKIVLRSGSGALQLFELWWEVQSAPAATPAAAAGVALNGNSIANTMVGDRLLVSAVGPLTAPDEVVQDMLSRAGVPATVDVIGDRAVWSLSEDIPDTLGPECILNGGFDSGTSWTHGTTWIISGGVASYSASGIGTLIQSMGTRLVAGKTYRITYTVVSISGGYIYCRLNGASAGQQITTPGTYSEDFVSTSPDKLYFYPYPTSGSGMSVVIDNVSIRELISAGGDGTAAYACNGAVTEYRLALDWVHDVAWQCRSYFRHFLGRALLIIRSWAPVAAKSLPFCRVDGGKRVHTRDKSQYGEVINTIDLHYGRDWSVDKSDKAYRGLVSDSNAPSIADYGLQERPDLFLCDFITDDAVAANLLAFYLAYYAVRHWLHSHETFYYDSELEFGDLVTLDFARGELVQVEEVGFDPGSDVIRIKSIQ